MGEKRAVEHEREREREAMFLISVGEFSAETVVI